MTGLLWTVALALIVAALVFQGLWVVLATLFFFFICWCSLTVVLDAIGA